jgi:cysteinyl-tRNA synthetase
MALQFQNSLTKKKETFTPVINNTVRMYNCGPTVYGDPHIGNFRSFIFADLLKRYLKFRGYTVVQVMNITDVGHLTSDSDEGEDKMEVAAKKEKLDAWQVAAKYTKSFMEAVETLGIEKADYYPKATEHVEEMIAITQELIKRGLAYVAGDDGKNVYCDVAAFGEYGKLSGNTLAKLKKQSRAVDDPNKKNPYDFVLWFSQSKYEGHQMQWDSPWGRGYPGWHIECSAMSMKYLSDTFRGDAFDPDKFETIDIHTGGEDNKFPHHEAEIAQTEGATGKQFARFWLHVTHLKVEGEKMSKSLGNFYTIQQLMDEGYNPKVVRYELMSTHYRQSLNFTKEGLKAAKSAIDRLQETIFALQHISKKESAYDADALIEKAKADFIKAMDDDLNVSGGLAVLFDTIKTINREKGKLSIADAKKLIAFMQEIDTVFNVMDFSESAALDESIEDLIAQRDEARKNKDFATSDKIRDQLKEQGITLIDTPEGTRWKRE